MTAPTPLQMRLSLGDHVHCSLEPGSTMLNTCVWPSLMYVVSSSASAAHGPPGIVCSVCADAGCSVARSSVASSAVSRSIVA